MIKEENSWLLSLLAKIISLPLPVSNDLYTFMVKYKMYLSNRDWRRDSTELIKQDKGQVPSLHTILGKSNQFCFMYWSDGPSCALWLAKPLRANKIKFIGGCHATFMFCKTSIWPTALFARDSTQLRLVKKLRLLCCKTWPHTMVPSCKSCRATRNTNSPLIFSRKEVTISQKDPLRPHKKWPILVYDVRCLDEVDATHYLGQTTNRIDLVNLKHIVF